MALTKSITTMCSIASISASIFQIVMNSHIKAASFTKRVLFNCLFIYLFLAVLVFTAVQASGSFSSSREQRLLSTHGVRVSHCRAFSCCRAQALSAFKPAVAAWVRQLQLPGSLEHKLKVWPHRLSCVVYTTSEMLIF